MKLSTKSIVSLAHVLSLTQDKARHLNRRQRDKIERLLRRHDRKASLRASVLGIDPAQLRQLQRQINLDEIVKKAGFADCESFLRALNAKLRYELRTRGWSTSRIQHI